MEILIHIFKVGTHGATVWAYLSPVVVTKAARKPKRGEEAGP